MSNANKFHQSQSRLYVDTLRLYFFIAGFAIGVFVVLIVWASMASRNDRVDISAMDADKSRVAAFSEVARKIGPSPTQPAISESFLVRMSPRRIDVHFEVTAHGSKEMPRSQWVIVTELFDDGTWHATYGDRIK